MGKNWRDEHETRTTDELTQPGPGWSAYCLRLLATVGFLYGAFVVFAHFN